MEKDLFNHIETLPLEVQNVLSEYENKWDESYQMCREMKARLEQLGYTFEYYLDAIPYDLKKL
jgi:hypothetical protein